MELILFFVVMTEVFKKHKNESVGVGRTFARNVWKKKYQNDFQKRMDLN